MDRLVQQAAVRSARRESPASYPISLPYRYLTRAQQQERLDNAEDVLRCIDQWLPSDLLSLRQRQVLLELSGLLCTSRGKHAITPSEWEQFWSVRDFLLPAP